MPTIKMLAYEDKHEVYPSSTDEFEQFVNGHRPDFDNSKVLAVKFAFSLEPDNLEEAEETRWFINELAVDVPSEFACTTGGAKMPAELPPFLLVLAPRFTKRTVFAEYERFVSEQTNYDIDSLSLPELTTVFLQWLEANPY